MFYSSPCSEISQIILVSTTNDKQAHHHHHPLPLPSPSHVSMTFISKSKLLNNTCNLNLLKRTIDEVINLDLVSPFYTCLLLFQPDLLSFFRICLRNYDGRTLNSIHADITIINPQLMTRFIKYVYEKKKKREEVFQNRRKSFHTSRTDANHLSYLGKLLLLYWLTR